jgi:hypothetical protein
LWIYPGIKSEFLRPKSFIKNFIYAIKIPDKKLRKKFVSIIYPGYQIQDLPVFKMTLKFIFPVIINKKKNDYSLITLHPSQEDTP